MPRKSSIKQLPPPIKTEIDRLLSDGRTTIDEIVAHLQKLGVTVSRSAVGRYSQRFEDVSRKMREAREISTAFAKELGDFKNDEVGRQITEMLRTVIFNVLLPRVSDEEPTVEPADLMFMAKAIKELSSANKMSADMELRIRKEAAEQAKRDRQKERIVQRSTGRDEARRFRIGGINARNASRIFAVSKAADAKRLRQPRDRGRKIAPDGVFVGDGRNRVADRVRRTVCGRSRRALSGLQLGNGAGVHRLCCRLFKTDFKGRRQYSGHRV